MLVAQQITHVIFDFDGILVDSERQYSKANELCLKPYGKWFTNEMKIAQMGRKKPDAVRILLEMNDLVGKIDMEEYLKNYDAHLEYLIPKASELPGVSKLINHLHAENFPLAICTGSDSEEFTLKTKNFDKNHWINKISFCVLSGSDPDIKNGKPHPEPYLVTLRRFKEQPISPKNVLVFEDSINGVISAVEAGMTVIMIPQLEFMPQNWAEIKKELEPKISEILNSINEFIPEKYGLPAY